MCSSFFIFTFLNPYLLSYWIEVDDAAKQTYLSDKCGVGRGSKILGQDLLLEFIHRVDDEVMSSVLRPVNDVFEPLFVDRPV